MNTKKILSAIFVTAIFSFLFVNIYKNWPMISSYPWQFKTQNTFFLLVLLAPLYIVNGMSWYLVNRALGIKVSYFKSLKILILGNFARFIPGGIWQYAGRVYLSRKEGIPESMTISAVLTETLFTLLTGVIVIATVGLFWKLPMQNGSFIWLFIALLFLLLSAVFFSNERFVNLLSKLMKRLVGREGLLPLRLSAGWVPILLITFSLQFVLAGAVLHLLTQNATPIPLGFYPLFVGIFAMSWILGFITIFAPSGLGVQEVTMATLLSAYMPFPVASLVAIVFRLVLFVSEAVTALLILAKERKDYGL